MLSYEEALRHWAALRWGIPLDEIERVSLDIEEGDPRSGCSTCDWGREYTRVEVGIHRGRSVTAKTIDKDSLDEVLKEIFGVGSVGRGED